MSKPKRTPPMDRNEMVAILNEIARDPKQQPGPRVTALRTLREMDQEAEEAGTRSGFDALDTDELAPKRRAKRARR